MSRGNLNKAAANLHPIGLYRATDASPDVNIVALQIHNIPESINHFPGETGWDNFGTRLW